MSTFSFDQRAPVTEPVSGPYRDSATQTSEYLSPGGRETQGGTNFFDLTLVRGVLYRQRWILLASIVALLAIGFVVSLLMTPIYTASATVVVDPYGPNIVEGQGVERERSSMDVYPYMRTLGEIVESRRLAGTVYDALGSGERAVLLDGLPDDFATGKSPEELATAMRSIGTNVLQGMVKAEIPIESRIVTITVTARDAELAAKLANLYTDSVAMEDVRKTGEANTYALRYLTEQIADVRSKLLDAEGSVTNYARSNNIIAQVATPTDDTDNAYSETTTVATLSSANQAFNAARARRIEAQQRWAAVAGVPASQLREVQESDAIQGLLEKRAETTAQLSELQVRYGNSYPQIQELQAQIASLDRQISQQSAAVKNAIRVDYEVAKRQEDGLSSELARASGSAISEQDRRVGFNQLTREAEALSNQLKILLNRYNELNSASNLKQSSVTKLDQAQAPSAPSSPNFQKNLIIALLMGLGVGIALAILRESFDDRLRSLEDVEAKLGLPLLGQTPAVASSDMKNPDSDGYGALMEAYSSIRAVLESTLPRDQNVLQVTSSQPGEGKSLTAVILARKAAQIGRKVLLVDADLRRPSIASQFNLKRPERGTAEVLLGHAQLSEGLIDVGVPNLSVLPVGAIPPNPVELLSSGAVEAFIEANRKKFDLIIFDSSPVIGLADALRLSHAVDATIFLAEANRAHYGQIKPALRQLRSAGAKIIGVILSKYSAKDAGHYYAYAYDYYNYGEKAAA